MTTVPKDGLPSLGKTRLITKPRDPQKYISNRTTDARTAICQGLKEYIEQLSILGTGGQEVRFRKVFDTWADWEKQAEYPSAVVHSTAPGMYDASSMKPLDPVPENQTPDGSFIVKLSEFRLSSLMIEVWSTELAERKYVAAMLEDALNPVNWMYGFRLECPHYFNARAEFELIQSQYLDDEQRAGKRYRLIQFEMKAQIDNIRLAKLPLAKPKLDSEVVDASGAVVLSVT